MLIICKILDVSLRDHMDKTSKQNVKVADVIMLPSDGGEPIRSTLWANSVSNGEHEHYKQFQGKEVILSVRPDVFSGRVQFNLNTSVRPKLYAPAPQPGVTTRSTAA